MKEAGAAAIHSDHNQYTRPAGHPQLVNTLARYYSAELGRSLDAQSEVCVVGGATNAIFSAVMALVDPGDEVVCIEPYFDAPKIAADLMGAKTVGAPRAPSGPSGMKLSPPPPSPLLFPSPLSHSRSACRSAPTGRRARPTGRSTSRSSRPR